MGLSSAGCFARRAAHAAVHGSHVREGDGRGVRVIHGAGGLAVGQLGGNALAAQGAELPEGLRPQLKLLIAVKGGGVFCHIGLDQLVGLVDHVLYVHRA